MDVITPEATDVAQLGTGISFHYSRKPLTTFPPPEWLFEYQLDIEEGRIISRHPWSLCHLETNLPLHFYTDSTHHGSDASLLKEGESLHWSPDYCMLRNVTDTYFSFWQTLRPQRTLEVSKVV